MSEQQVHHYPPDLFDLLVNAIPRLIKGKQGVLDFFLGCGVERHFFADLQRRVNESREDIGKFEIVRVVLRRLNDNGDASIRERREVLKRVTQWDDFSSCYDNQRMEAEGYVAKVRNVVNVKDSFTRMQQAQERSLEADRKKRASELDEKQRLRETRRSVRADLNALVFEPDTKKRGIALESVLNRLFQSEGISVREAFKRVGPAAEGVVEQIDGVIALDGAMYLVEMKWWSEPIGVPEVSAHLVRVHHRAGVGGIMISSSRYTDPAIAITRDALPHRVCLLATLSEIVLALEREHALVDLLRAKVQAAVLDKNPFLEGPGILR